MIINFTFEGVNNLLLLVTFVGDTREYLSFDSIDKLKLKSLMNEFFNFLKYCVVKIMISKLKLTYNNVVGALKVFALLHVNVWS